MEGGKHVKEDKKVDRKTDSTFIVGSHRIPGDAKDFNLKTGARG